VDANEVVAFFEMDYATAWRASAWIGRLPSDPKATAGVAEANSFGPTDRKVDDLGAVKEIFGESLRTSSIKVDSMKLLEPDVCGATRIVPNRYDVGTRHRESWIGYEQQDECDASLHGA
jgi:hypothetical protein